MTLPSYLKTEEEKRMARYGTVIGYLVGLPICAALFMWYNHVLIQRDVAYWQWLALSAPILIAVKAVPPIRYVFAVVFAVSVVSQAAAWVGLMSLPIIK